VRPVERVSSAVVDEPVELAFRVVDPATGEGVEGLGDFQVLTVLAPGRWHQRQPVEEVGNGVYRTSFTPTRPGAYYAYAGTRSRGATFNRNPYLTFRVVAASEASVADAAQGAER
jgi:hypothetical protein